MRRFEGLLVVCALVVCAGCGGESGGDIPECSGAAVTPFAGSQQLLISELQIGAEEDGFDLDHDGLPDNKLALAGSLARLQLEQAFADYTMVLPIEMFDIQGTGADECVKFAVYIGEYLTDIDQDGATPVIGSDCNDGDAAIGPGVAEVAGNLVDDDCDGLADEDVDGTPSADTGDMDQDGVTIADGDCDDTDSSILGSGAELCGDGKDNDCTGVADDGCSPYDETPDAVRVDPLSFGSDGKPLIVFDNGRVDDTGHLFAGPSIFSIVVPIVADLNLDLKITSAQIEADLVMTANGVTMQNARLGGLLDAHTLDQLRGLTVDIINLRPEDSLLDALFASVLGTTILMLDENAEGCLMPDIDVDGDGHEAFCDTVDDELGIIDTCIDGDGTVYTDEVVGGVTVHCTELENDDGSYKFADGVSVALTFAAVPTLLQESD